MTPPTHPAPEIAEVVTEMRSAQACFTTNATIYRWADAIEAALAQHSPATGEERAEAVATLLPPDPEDERDGPWFSLNDLAKLRQLPTGTKLYTAPPTPTDSPTIAEDLVALLQRIQTHLAVGCAARSGYHLIHTVLAVETGVMLKTLSTASASGQVPEEEWMAEFERALEEYIQARVGTAIFNVTQRSQGWQKLQRTLHRALSKYVSEGLRAYLAPTEPTEKGE